MEIREATPDDADDIRSIARASLRSSYAHFLDEETIDDAVDRWYGGETLAENVEGEDMLWLVAEIGGEPVAFSQSDFVGEGSEVGQIDWIHVHPDHRGGGTGVRVLVRTREGLLDGGADEVRSVVLANNETGNEFYLNHGFERAGEREIDIGDETFTENIYVESGVETGAEPADEWRAVQAVDLEDDETVYVAYGEATRGSKAPFYSAYETEDGTRRYGWFCGNCDTMDNAMDAMGRIECNRCGNRRKATRWDASYL